MPRKIIVDTSIKLGAKASEFIMNGPNNMNEYINAPEIDFILTNDKNILEKMKLWLKYLQKIITKYWWQHEN